MLMYYFIYVLLSGNRESEYLWFLMNRKIKDRLCDVNTIFIIFVEIFQAMEYSVQTV